MQKNSEWSVDEAVKPLAECVNFACNEIPVCRKFSLLCIFWCTIKAENCMCFCNLQVKNAFLVATASTQCSEAFDCLSDVMAMWTSYAVTDVGRLQHYLTNAETQARVRNGSITSIHKLHRWTIFRTRAGNFMDKQVLEILQKIFIS